MSTNPLRQPPFFPVANVNPDDPIRYGVSSFTQSLTVIALADAHLNLSTFWVYSVQIEQIEQLNTLLLQDIDHNFARFHDVVNNKILPQVKRYGIVSEPTRAASEVSNTQRFMSEPAETHKTLTMIFVITLRYAVLEDVLLLGSFRSDGTRTPTS
jgi:hypothetical protein